MAAIQITISSQLQTQFSQRDLKISQNINEEMLEDDQCQIFLNSYFIPMTAC